MSPLSVTLFDFLHCHPGEMSSVSLLPVANVLLSAVEPGVKSRKNPPLEYAVNELLRDGTGRYDGLDWPPAVKRSCQSGGDVDALATLPSSWKLLVTSADAVAVLATTTPAVARTTAPTWEIRRLRRPFVADPRRRTLLAVLNMDRPPTVPRRPTLAAVERDARKMSSRCHPPKDPAMR